MVVTDEQNQHYFNSKNHQNSSENKAVAVETETLNDVFSPATEINRTQIVNEFNAESLLHQPRNRLGLLLPPTIEVPSPSSDTTPTQTTPIQSRSKQGSPFYAEPADALGNVIRRSQRASALPQSQRHSEPPKGPLRSGTQFQQVLSPIESEKSYISGSLDELKKKNRTKARGRLDPWPVDSSWEFMGNDEQNDYDTDENWKTVTTDQSNSEQITVKKSPIPRNASRQKLENRITINQIIAKRLPELKITELMQKTTPPAISVSPENSRSGTIRSSRISAYDNVERGHSGYATSMICHDSAQSDDGTVFSEPWDSSQWDSFLPHDGKRLLSSTFISSI